jgi:hypothetical protein
VRQTKSALAIIVNVANIDPASVRVQFHTHRVCVAFHSIGSGASYACDLVLNSESASGASGFSEQLSTYDVAGQNMALVCTKLVPGFWHTQGEGSSEERIQSIAEDESKGDSMHTEAGALISAQPYTYTTPMHTTPTTHTTPGEAEAEAVVNTDRAAVNTSKTADAAVAKAHKIMQSYEKTIQIMKFDNNDALFELD